MIKCKNYVKWLKEITVQQNTNPRTHLSCNKSSNLAWNIDDLQINNLA